MMKGQDNLAPQVPRSIIAKAMLVILLAAASSALLPASPHLGRRAALLGGLAAAAHTSASTAATPDNLPSILERAEKGTLRATPVLTRARSDKLVSPKDVATCKQLANLMETDNEVLYEMLPAVRNYIKSKQTADMDFKVEKLLKSMLDEHDVARGRVSRQLNALADERSARGCP